MASVQGACRQRVDLSTGSVSTGLDCGVLTLSRSWAHPTPSPLHCVYVSVVAVVHGNAGRVALPVGRATLLPAVVGQVPAAQAKLTCAFGCFPVCAVPHWQVMGEDGFALLVARVEEAVAANVIQSGPWRAVIGIVHRRMAATRGVATASELDLPVAVSKPRRKSITMRQPTRGLNASASL